MNWLKKCHGHLRFYNQDTVLLLPLGNKQVNGGTVLSKEDDILFFEQGNEKGHSSNGPLYITY